MFQRLIKFFSNFFRKKDQQVAEPEKVLTETPEAIPDKSGQEDDHLTEYQKSEADQTEPQKEATDFQKEAVISKKEIPQKKTVRPKQNRKKPESEKQEIEEKTPRQANKHGIPILTNDDDLFNLLAGNESKSYTSHKPEKPPEEPEPEGNFSDMLEESLDKDFDMLLEEKESGMSPEEITINERIKTYPPPQDEIDLHGYTANEAETKTESFIQIAAWNGIRTVRIIVGKGLHSRGKAVLRDVIEKKVADLKKKELVLTFRWEKQEKLKSGSLIVYLG